MYEDLGSSPMCVIWMLLNYVFFYVIIYWMRGVMINS